MDRTEFSDELRLRQLSYTKYPNQLRAVLSMLPTPRILDQSSVAWIESKQSLELGKTSRQRHHSTLTRIQNKNQKVSPSTASGRLFDV